ncbi:MAG TPA: hypothetical protein VEJ41_07160 [Candidatus Acidoferrales bacterium]|nr:hypothetical protein [Candidatus Acidoferrales bacterium]
MSELARHNTAGILARCIVLLGVVVALGFLFGIPGKADTTNQGSQTTGVGFVADFVGVYIFRDGRQATRDIELSGIHCGYPFPGEGLWYIMDDENDSGVFGHSGTFISTVDFEYDTGPGASLVAQWTGAVGPVTSGNQQAKDTANMNIWGGNAHIQFYFITARGSVQSPAYQLKTVPLTPTTTPCPPPSPAPASTP